VTDEGDEMSGAGIFLRIPAGRTGWVFNDAGVGFISRWSVTPRGMLVILLAHGHGLRSAGGVGLVCAVSVGDTN